ncbi:AAA family ATPase [Nonomuraea sp. NPDC049400]|uniref:AAA family ATPase n=1 Tax=Nonomuraea sp. NPDC049400 TaxID=3364352 RepID=UPI0037A492F7
MLYVVTGPPAAGKSTWVQQRAQPGDIVVDFDALAAALTGPGHDGQDGNRSYPKTLRDVTYRARRAAVDEALKHCADVDVYVIHSHLSDHARTIYSDHDAQFIVVDPGKAVVLERIRLMRSPSMRAVALRWYASSSPPPVSHSLCSTPQQSRSW